MVIPSLLMGFLVGVIVWDSKDDDVPGLHHPKNH